MRHVWGTLSRVCGMKRMPELQTINIILEVNAANVLNALFRGGHR